LLVPQISDFNDFEYQLKNAIFLFICYDSGRWMVLIDAAKGCATKLLDLSEHPADFVVVSFYKVCM
jgi:hypothetical protein